MNPNLTTYLWAEQLNRQRLMDEGRRVPLGEAVLPGRAATSVAKRRRTMGTLLVRAGVRLRGVHSPGSSSPALNPNAIGS